MDVPLCPLELAAVQVGEHVAKVPDLMGLEALLAESYEDRSFPRSAWECIP